MLGIKHFRTLYDADEQGPIVTVTHLPTNQTYSARPTAGQSTRKVRSVLEHQIIATFLNFEADLRFEVGRCELRGKIGGFYRVQHLPTQRSKSCNTIDSPNIDHNDLIDMLLLELWNEGLLPLRNTIGDGTGTRTQ
jgi:hypothetical protein